MILALLTVALSITTTASTSFRIPSYLNKFGSPIVNATISGTVFAHRTMPMRVTLDSTTTVGHPRVPQGLVHVSTLEGGRFALADPHIYFHGGIGPPSTLAIGRNSHVRVTHGPVAYSRNEFVVNSTRAEFVSSCLADTYMAIGLNGLDHWNGNIQAEGQTVDVVFKLSQTETGIIGAFPFQVGMRIGERLVANGAVIATRRFSLRDEASSMRTTHRGFREDVFANCSSETAFSGLPNVTLNFNGVGSLVLSPRDYIHVDDIRRECLLRFSEPAPAIVGGYFVFNPLEIPHLNVRVSDDLLEICDESTTV